MRGWQHRERRFQEIASGQNVSERPTRFDVSKKVSLSARVWRGLEEVKMGIAQNERFNHLLEPTLTGGRPV
jgi:hypothetical protein